MIIPGYTDGYVGSAPDVGAYERGSTPWVAGPDWSLTPEPILPTYLHIALQSPTVLQLTGEDLSPAAEYLIETSTNLVT